MAGLRARCWPFSAEWPVPNSPVSRLHEEGLGLPCSQPGGLLGRSEQLGKGWGGTKGEACGGDRRSGEGRAGPAGSKQEAPRKGTWGEGVQWGSGWAGSGLQSLGRPSFLIAVRGLWAEAGVSWGVMRRFSRWRGRQLHVGSCSLGDERPPSVLSARYVPCPSTWPGVSAVVPTAGHTYARSAHRAPFCPRRVGGGGMWWAGRRPAVVWMRLDGSRPRAWGPLTKGSWGACQVRMQAQRPLGQEWPQHGGRRQWVQASI